MAGEHRRRIGGDALHRAREAGAEELAAQPLDQHRRHVAAPVAAHVDDQALLADLAVEVLDELLDAGGAHVGDVQVADPPVRRRVDLHPVRGHLGEIAQVGLARDGPEGRLAGRAVGGGERRRRAQGQPHRPVGLVPQPAVGVVGGGEFLAVDGQHVVARAGVHPDLGQRRPVARLLVVPLEDFGEAVAAGGAVELEHGPRQGDLGALRGLPVAPRDVGVADVQLGHHLADHVVQVRPVGDVVEPGAVLLAQGRPVVAVHVVDVEEVAEPPPHFVEDLHPLVGRHPVHHQPRRRDRLRVALPRRGVQLVAPPDGDQHLLAVARHRVAPGVGGQGLGLPILERERADLGGHVAPAPVELRARADVEHPPVARAQPRVVVELDGQPHHPPGEAVEIDADGRVVLAVLRRVGGGAVRVLVG